ncbi:MAG TPA: sigma-54 dependent transcriptional regulator [Denitromonas sp.]|uniref:sigma-54-dependent transcriptional regulator n=1 Tax=Denitromonas sp. TaxID=2734609 RepID=UPI001D593802|nr:sigma-54-dependent Fis family transcriptional regulator [Rhodocyclaceae bacterium]MCP5222615.1 sigma-54-dependent Fis family transcriptional regulator [Zoogloeaceae bacterium]HQU88292.1 sigma-54 dependent transcriptional regulator [Denitromonas sp.]HQV15039.1 sigma-54 dependent transcriptional regulator [Denitromonas sp.]
MQRDVLILDPEDELVTQLTDTTGAGWRFHHVRDLEAALLSQQRHRCRVGIVVIRDAPSTLASGLPRLTATAVSEWIAVVAPHVLDDTSLRPCIVQHFHDFHTLPADGARLLMTLGHAYGKALVHARMHESAGQETRFGMVGQSKPMQALYEQLDKVVKVDVPVLLSGESGTGKELVARAIHRYSARAAGPFVAMNCAAVPGNLIQSELFGHEKGAFTGAQRRTVGNIEASTKGVLFLDEIGDLSLDLQTNLLRFLQDMTIVRVGGTETIAVDTRVVAASHVDLSAAIAAGRFRADLFYRLDVVHLHVPPLRDRRDDIRQLAKAVFHNNIAIKSPRLTGFSEAAFKAMEAYHWPGNVRDLINRVRRAMIMCDGTHIAPADLGLGARLSPFPEAMTLEGARTEFDREMVQRCLRQNDANVSSSARQLGVSRGTLYRLMARLGIDSNGHPDQSIN